MDIYVQKLTLTQFSTSSTNQKPTKRQNLV
jgi:hypothetical protein